MLKKPEGCEGCPLEHKGKGFCKDKLAKNPKYLFIGETPDKVEINKGEPFTGKAGFVLENWLIRAIPTIRLAKERNEISYANLLRCLPPEIQKKTYPKGEERVVAEVQCRQYDEIPESIHTVVLFGDAPQRWFFKDELDAEDAATKRLGRDLKGIMGRIGREIIKDGKRWIFAPHPSAILKQPALVQHGQMALSIAAGDSKAIEPDYIKWEEALKELE